MRHDYKMDFLENRFLPYLQELQRDGRKYIITGDLNMVHQRIDIKVLLFQLCKIYI